MEDPTDGAEAQDAMVALAAKLQAAAQARRRRGRRTTPAPASDAGAPSAMPNSVVSRLKLKQELKVLDLKKRSLQHAREQGFRSVKGMAIAALKKKKLDEEYAAYRRQKKEELDALKWSQPEGAQPAPHREEGLSSDDEPYYPSDGEHDGDDSEDEAAASDAGGADDADGAGTQLVDTAPADDVDTQLVGTQLVDTQLVDTQLVDTAPVEEDDTQLVDTVPVEEDTQLVDTQLVSTVPVDDIPLEGASTFGATQDTVPFDRAGSGPLADDTQPVDGTPLPLEEAATTTPVAATQDTVPFDRADSLPMEDGADADTDGGDGQPASPKKPKGPRNSAYRALIEAEESAAKAQARRTQLAGGLVAAEADEDEEEGVAGMGKFGAAGDMAAKLFGLPMAADEEEDPATAALNADDLEGVVDDLSSDEEDGVDAAVRAKMEQDRDKAETRALQRRILEGQRGRHRDDEDTDSELDEAAMDREEFERRIRAGVHITDLKDFDDDDELIDGEGNPVPSAAKDPDVDSEEEFEKAMLEAHRMRTERSRAMKAVKQQLEGPGRILHVDRDSQAVLAQLVRTNSRCPSINLARPPSASPTVPSQPSPALFGGPVRSAFSAGLGLDKTDAPPLLKRTPSFMDLTLARAPSAPPSLATPASSASIIHTVASNTRFVFTSDNSRSQFPGGATPTPPPLATPTAGSTGKSTPKGTLFEALFKSRIVDKSRGGGVEPAPPPKRVRK